MEIQMYVSMCWIHLINMRVCFYMYQKGRCVKPKLPLERRSMTYCTLTLSTVHTFRESISSSPTTTSPSRRASSTTAKPPTQCSHELCAPPPEGCLPCAVHTAPLPTILSRPMTPKAVNQGLPFRPPMPRPLPPRVARTRSSRRA